MRTVTITRAISATFSPESYFGNGGIMIPESIEEMTQHVKSLWFCSHGGVQLKARFDDLGSFF